MLPETTADERPEQPMRDDLAEYGAYAEVVGADDLLVEIGGMAADEYRLSQAATLGAGWGPLVLGRVDPLKPNEKPHKRIWDCGRTGWLGTDATADELTTAEDIAARIVSGRDRGLLNSGARVPVGVVGLDVDNYGDKQGLASIARCEGKWGTLPLTYRLTARGFAGGSGIRFYRVPLDFVAVGEIPAIDGHPSHVEIIQRHHRYAVAPGGLHHTGATYGLYDEHSGELMPPYWLPRPEELPALPVAWLDGLRSKAKPRKHGQAATPADVAAFADEFTFNQFPDALVPVVRSVRETGGTGRTGGTRNACRAALYRAAHEAEKRAYPWDVARGAIKAAAIAAYAERGLTLDERDFDRLADGAVTAVLGADEYAELADESGDDRTPTRRRGPLFDPSARATYRPTRAAQR